MPILNAFFVDFADIARLNGGFMEARILQVALGMGVFEALGAGESTAEEVAAKIGADSRATGLLLNALAALSLLTKSGARFGLTDGARTYLTQDSPRYFGGMILFDASLWDLWGRLEEAVRSGMPIRIPDMFQQSRKETERFILAMHSLVMARGDGDVVCKALDLTRAHTLLDVGGGPGTYPLHFCRAFPNLQVSIFDLPRTLEVTKEILGPTGLLGERVVLVEGDYNRDQLPGGFDAAFLSNVIHAEREEQNRVLLRKVFRALKPAGEVIIKDHIMNETLTKPVAGAVFSLQMLITTRGRDYSYQEVGEWLEDAGFCRAREVRLAPPMTSSLILARKPER